MNCKGDADTKIVSTVLDLAGKHDKAVVVVVADDTGIAVMLISIGKSQTVTLSPISKGSTKHGI